MEIMSIINGAVFYSGIVFGYTFSWRKSLACFFAYVLGGKTSFFFAGLLGIDMNADSRTIPLGELILLILVATIVFITAYMGIVTLFESQATRRERS